MSLPQFTEEKILNLDKMHLDYRESEIQRLIGEVFDAINHEGYRFVAFGVRQFLPLYHEESRKINPRQVVSHPYYIKDIDLSQNDLLIPLNSEDSPRSRLIAELLISKSYRSIGSKKLIKQITGDYNTIKGSIIFSHIYPISSLLTKKGLDPNFNVKVTELYVFQGIKEIK